MGVIIRQSIKGTIVNYVGAVVGMFTTFFVLTKYLLPQEVGLMRAFVDAGMLFAGLAQIGTNASILRFFPYFKNVENKNNGFFLWPILIPFIGFCIYLLVFLIFKDAMANFFGKESKELVNYLYFIIPLGFFILYQVVFETNSVVLHRVVVPAFVREVGVRLMILISYLLFAFHYISLTGLVVAFCGTYGIAACINLAYLIHLKRISLVPNLHISKSLRKQFFFYTLFLIGSALTTTIVPTFSSFFVAAKMGLAFTGVYAIARHIVALIEIPYRSLGAISNPHISQTVKENNFVETNRLIKKISLHQFLVGTAIFFVIWINIDLIYQIIPNGENYAPGKWVVFILGLLAILNTSVAATGSTLSFSKYYYYSLIFTFILAVSAVVLNVVFLPVWGINGAALASFISYFIYYLLLILLVYWKLKVSPFSWKHLKILTIILTLFALNFIWNKISSQFIMQHFKPALWLNFCETVVRTFVLGGIGFLSIYFLNISDEVNVLVKKMLLKKISKT
jgi:O-antigen/teichoic acid export membrane protein